MGLCEGLWMFRCKPCAKALCCLFAGAFLTGCASVRVDEQGVTHVAGIVWLTLPAKSAGDAAADVVRARSIGLSIHRSPDGSGVTLGYSDQMLATIYNNSIVRLPPVFNDVERER